MIPLNGLGAVHFLTDVEGFTVPAQPVGLQVPRRSQIRFIPRNRIRHIVVEDLTDVDGVVAEAGEVLRHGHRFRIDLPEFIAQVPYAGGVRPEARHQAGPGRGAYRSLTEGLPEGHAFCRQAVDIWGEHYRIAVSAEGGAEVVYGEEEDVGFGFLFLRLASGHDRQCRE